MQRRTRCLITAICLLALCVPATLAQDTQPEIVLSLRRDFGYGGFGEIQGAFRLTAAGPSDLTRVVFLLDERVLGEATAPPWQLRFHTDSYPPGNHTLVAIGYTQDGAELRSNEIRTRFLSSQEAGKATTRLIVVLLGGILGLMALSALVSSLLVRRRGPSVPSGRPRDYGLAGGAVCSRCGRPFARHLWAPNLMLGKLERCPYCGKWGVVRAASPAELAAAEAAELEGITAPEQGSTESATEQLRRDLEESRFHDQ